MQSGEGKYLGVSIALAAALGLFAELSIIRIHASYFQLFAYFKNISLLSAFLGLGVGYALGSRRPIRMILVMPLLSLQIMTLYALRSFPLTYTLQNPVPENLTLGLAHGEGWYVLLSYAFLLAVFALNAFIFIPLGQLASALMQRMNVLRAYGWNLTGSIFGILLFSILSFLWTPPIIWLSCVAVGVAFATRKRIASLAVNAISLCVALLILMFPVHSGAEYYSPYQVLALFRSPQVTQREDLTLVSNNTYFQRMLNLSPETIEADPTLAQQASYYYLPYAFIAEPQDVLVVGSGTGNDVSAALHSGAGAVDAVEIDPLILRLGREFHPEQVYDSQRVNLIVNDARAHLRYTEKSYDLIVYGLLDSHSLLSGSASGIRLDSFVYTIEAFREARSRLKDGGIMSLTFSIMSPELSQKLFNMLTHAFDGVQPRVFHSSYDGGVTFIAHENPATLPMLRPIPFPDITETLSAQTVRADSSTDDWPFFYMPKRTYPLSYALLLGMLFIAAIAFIRLNISGARTAYSLPAFFLGAGFMLIETKGITELALYFGSTWFVTSIIIVSILIMAFLANIVVMKFGVPNPKIVYPLLVLSILLGYGATFIDFSIAGPIAGKTVIPLLLTVPLFFSGLAFSGELARSGAAGVALSSNLIGAMLGGILEYNSMYFGFRTLYLVAIVMYACAFAASIRVARRSGPQPTQKQAHGTASALEGAP